MGELLLLLNGLCSRLELTQLKIRLQGKNSLRLYTFKATFVFFGSFQQVQIQELHGQLWTFTGPLNSKANPNNYLKPTFSPRLRYETATCIHSNSLQKTLKIFINRAHTQQDIVIHTTCKKYHVACICSKGSNSQILG